MTELVAKLPFEKGTKASQSLSTSFNNKSFYFLLQWNAQGFFTLRVTSGSKMFLNRKLTDAALSGNDPSTFFPEFLILPFDIEIDTLDLRIMNWDAIV